MDINELKETANSVRRAIIRSIYTAQSGHPGSSLSIVELLTILYMNFLRLDKDHPDDENRDRFILSKGHAAPALYGIFVELGILKEEELDTLRRLGSRLPGHPNMNLTPGIDMSTGSLGQGLSAAVGMALAGKLDKKDYHVYALVGDGELQEGQIWEAAMFAGSNNLDNLTVFVDNNNLQISGTIDKINSPYPIEDKFKAFNFETIVVEDGHDFEQLDAAIKKALAVKDKPTAVIFKTVKGKGISYMENQLQWHRKEITDEEYQKAMQELDEKFKK